MNEKQNEIATHKSHFCMFLRLLKNLLMYKYSSILLNEKDPDTQGIVDKLAYEIKSDLTALGFLDEEEHENDCT